MKKAKYLAPIILLLIILAIVIPNMIVPITSNEIATAESWRLYAFIGIVSFVILSVIGVAIYAIYTEIRIKDKH